jgi:hypothetical protein
MPISIREAAAASKSRPSSRSSIPKVGAPNPLQFAFHNRPIPTSPGASGNRSSSRAASLPRVAPRVPVCTRARQSALIAQLAAASVTNAVARGTRELNGKGHNRPERTTSPQNLGLSATGIWVRQRRGRRRRPSALSISRLMSATRQSLNGQLQSVGVLKQPPVSGRSRLALGLPA